MKPFKIEQNKQIDKLNMSMSGYIDEFAEFPGKVDFVQKICLNLNDVEGINSIGTKNWCQWLEKVKSLIIIEAENCPLLFVKLFNTVLGSKPQNLKVCSFYVPYVSTSNPSERKNVLFRLGVEFTEAGEINLPEVKDKSGVDMELDAMSQYFNFLKK